MRRVWLLLALVAVPCPGAEGPDLRLVWRSACATCHGPDGGGRLGSMRLPGPSLLEARGQPPRPEAERIRAILEGKGAMPAFRGRLSEADARRLLRELLPKGKG